ncbi:MAG: peptidoglycan DD-metalloendopeptidase family protein [Thermodesulfobacteriota bacterium]
MDSNRFTLIVLSSANRKIRQFMISRHSIALFSALILAVLLLGGYGLYRYMASKDALQQVKALKRVNQVQQQKIQTIALELDELRQRLARLQELDKKIRVIADLEHKGVEGQSPGMGGVSPEEGVLQSLKQERKDRWVKRLRQEVERFRDLASQQETSLEALVEQLRDRRDLLARTPSIWPTQGWLTCGFGYRQSPFTGLREFHRGVDVSAKPGTPVIAPADGLVVETGNDPDYGNIIRLDHGLGYKTFYAHLSETVVKKGQRVHRGQMIGNVGNTGRSTGPHLHYEVHLNGTAMNPLRYVLN